MQLLGQNPRANRYFGAAVAVNGIFAVVGAPMGRELDIPLERGEAHVFVRSLSWQFHSRLESQYTHAGDFFGASVAMATDRIMVGMPGALPLAPDDENRNRRGVTVFTREGSYWVQNERVVPNQHRPLEMFGASVAFDGSRVTVGAPYAPLFADAGAPGSSYVFTVQPDASWSQLARLQSANGQTNDAFGLSVTHAANWVAVGALLQDNPDALSGAVHLFDLTQPVLTIRQTAEGAWLEWNAAYADFTLESSATLAPDANWQPVEPPPLGTEHLIHPTDANRFYRLAKP
ncbi:MAG: hypothetical protein KIS67_25090 [Verrucomicrobiae bacterium]|nr:hypothetical protein [Verrucomicrobiae bacterium]